MDFAGLVNGGIKKSPVAVCRQFHARIRRPRDNRRGAVAHSAPL